MPGTHVPGWLVPAVIVAGVAAAAVILAAPAANFTAALAVALGSVLVVPVVSSAGLIWHDEGALDTPFEPAQLSRSVDTTTTTLTRVQDVTAIRLKDAAEGAPDLAATQTSALAAVFIYATGQEVLPIGGFTGTIPSPTLSQLQADVRAGRFRLVIAPSVRDPRLAWIASQCTPLNPPIYSCAPARQVGAPRRVSRVSRAGS